MPVNKPGAFSLIELLVAIAGLALLAALLAPMFAQGLGSARRAACLSNLRQIYVGYALYAADHDGRVPPKFEVKKSGCRAPTRRRGARSIRTNAASKRCSPHIWKARTSSTARRIQATPRIPGLFGNNAAAATKSKESWKRIAAPSRSAS